MRALPSGALPHVVKLGISGYECQDLRRNQIVVQDCIRLTQQPQCFEREQFRIARARSNQINFSLHKTSFPDSEIDVS